MNRNLFLSFFLILGTHFLFAQENDRWFKIKDTISSYIIEFPTKPIESTQDVPTEKGSVKMNSYTLEAADGENLIYMTSFSKYPSTFFENGLSTFKDQDKVLNGSVSAAVSNTNGKLISDQKIVFNGYNGRITKIELNTISVDKLYIIKLQTILVGYKLYLSQVIYEKTNDGNENAKRFFESFELINIKE